jgi:hypothetical protein
VNNGPSRKEGTTALNGDQISRAEGQQKLGERTARFNPAQQQTLEQATQCADQ